MIKQFDLVLLAETLTADHLPPATSAILFEVPVLPAGAVGAVVEVYGNGAGYEVEFVSDAGDTLALVTLSPAQVRPAGLPEVARGALAG